MPVAIKNKVIFSFITDSILDTHSWQLKIASHHYFCYVIIVRYQW